MSVTLAKLMHKSASNEARERYANLAQNAAQYKKAFGDVVVLDTETTGLQVYSAELTEIAAVRLHNGEIQDTFQTFVKTSRPIPPAITELTGITDKDVADAPSAKEAVAKLSTFVQGAPIIAHNAAFDKGFIEAVEGGKDVGSTWIDSLALSRIALPLLKTHKLQDMAEAFGVAAVTHRALDDVHALSGMWPIMLAALATYPPGLLSFLATLHPEVHWPYRDIFAKLSEEGDNVAFSLKEARARLAAEQSEVESPKDDAFERVAELSGVTHEDVRAQFSASSALTQEIEGFEAREEQVEMSERVADALSSHTHLAIEVGTGVGKSLAYLVPLALFAKKNNAVAGVATKTNVLTDQIIEQELPRLARILSGGLSFAPLKGFEHYPCFRKVELACERALPEFDTPYASSEQTKQEMLTALATILAYASEFTYGDLDTLGIRWNMVPRALISTTSKECQRTHCPYYRSGCMLHGARRRAAEVDIVVTNHALLLCDIETEGKILPPIREWVVDEAHGFAQEARKQWAYTVSKDVYEHLMLQLGSREKGLLSRHIKQVSKLESPQPALGLLAKAASYLSEATPLADVFFEAVHAAVMELAPKTNYEQAELWVSDTVRETPAYGKVSVFGEDLKEKLHHAEHALLQYADCMQESEGSVPADLSQPLNTLMHMVSALEAFFSGERDNRVFSLAASQTRKKKRPVPESICVQELSVGPSLQEKLYANALSVTYCSGTLAAGKSFAHFENAIGFDLLAKDEYTTCQLSSPYDFDSHMSALVVQGAPEPGSPDYLDVLAKMLIDIHLAAEGSVLTLFTNRREMEATFKRVQPVLEEAHLHLVQQTRKANARRLAREFSENPNDSLFALRAFWEGFDASGDTLRCVVIPKLPFASPTDPLVKEREARDKAAFRDYSLPEAVLSVKQAAGRLIRTSTDIGIVMLADSRVTTKAYGKQFISALPTQHVEMVRPDELFLAVSNNLKRVERNR